MNPYNCRSKYNKFTCGRGRWISSSCINF